MSSLLYLLFTLVAFAAPHHIPAHREDHGPDLPEVGSSLFDKIFSVTESGTTRYDVPFPLARLAEKLTSGGAELRHATLPFSRSLQRPVDLSYDPLLNPRIVFAPIKDPAALSKNRLFFGYVKARDQIEVISYNDEAGRFEFQIVKDYSSQPKVYYVNRGKCVSCHQSQAPIFSTPGWNDTTLGLVGRLFVKKNGMDENSLSNREAAMKQVFGEIPIRENVAGFDMEVRDAGQIAFDERLWRFGCGSDDRCRLGLLLRTLSPKSRHSTAAHRHSREVIERSTLLQQGTYSSFLTPSSLGIMEVIRKFGTVDEVVSNPKAILEIIAGLYRLPMDDNPATLREEELLPGELNNPLFTFVNADRELLRSELPDEEKIAEILIQSFEKDPAVLFGGAIHRNRVMWTLLSSVNSPSAEKYAYWMRKPTPDKMLFEGAIPPSFRQRELNILSRHCASCHAAGLPFPPQFLVGTEEEVLENVRDLRRRMLGKLINNQMPPSFAGREEMKASGDYQIVMEYLKRMAE